MSKPFNSQQNYTITVLKINLMLKIVKTTATGMVKHREIHLWYTNIYKITLKLSKYKWNLDDSKHGLIKKMLTQHQYQ